MARCDNCGSPGWETKEGYECKKCGFKKIVASEPMLPGTLVFCEGCGCHYWDKCTNGHLLDKLKIIEMKVVRAKT